MLGLFLDFLSRQALTAEGGPVPYTEAMAAEDDDLLVGVSVDAGEEEAGA
jgi:antitoxin PrlF